MNMPDLNDNIQHILDAIRTYNNEYEWDIQSPSYDRGWILSCYLGEYLYQLDISKEVFDLQYRRSLSAQDLLLIVAEKAKKAIDKLVKEDLKKGNLVIKHKVQIDEDGNQTVISYQPPKIHKKNKPNKNNPFSLIDFS